MVRARREKGRSSVKISKHGKGDVSALGSAKDALDEQSVLSGTANGNDPALSTDVSNFLKELGLQNSGQKAKQISLKGKEKETVPVKLADKHVRREKNGSAKMASLSKHESVGKIPGPKVSTMKSPFVFHPISQWYSVLPPLIPNDSTPSLTPDKLSLLSAKAAELHDKDIKTFQASSSSNSSSSEAGFLSKIIHSGTLSDRLSALTLLVQSSPLHNVKALETLKSMAERGKGKGGRDESLKALRCVVDWWVGGGAPGRKLKYFRDQPLLHPDVNDEYLLLWYFEDWLKKYFFSVLQILENLSLDPLPYVRTQSLTLIFTLLRDKPEQEQNLLRLLVNKLGDTEKSICSRASYHLLQLLQTHPFMKVVVVREIVALVLKPPAPTSSSLSTTPTQASKHVRFNPKSAGEKKPGNAHAKYYAAVTFNQIVLMPADKDVAAALLDVYFEMFKETLGEGREEREEDEDAQTGLGENVKMDRKGRVLDSGKGKGTKGQPTKDVHVKGAAGFAEVEDSNSKLVSAILTGVNRALPFANIHAGDSRINKHIDTLFFITHTSTFNISLQALMLIQQITASLSSSSKSEVALPTILKSITERYYRALYASLHDARLATSSKQAMYLNLFFKSVKADPASLAENGSNDRAKALIRRFTQVLVSGGSSATEFVAGGLYLLGELFSSVPGLRTMISDPSPEELPDEERYDPRKRNPQYAHASSSALWELIPLLHHYHPAVSLHARQLLSSQPLTASPDLSQNTLSHFLDRFVYKNPKKLKSKEGDEDGVNGGRLGKGGSAMQPAASGVEGVKLLKGEIGYVGEELVNEKAFLRRKRADVPVDQIFFHDYFTRKHEKEKALAAKVKGQNKDKGTEEQQQENGSSDEETGQGDDDDWDEDVDSVAEEAEIWKAMKATIPKFEADDEDLMEDSVDEDEEPDLDGYSDMDGPDEEDQEEGEGEGNSSEGEFSLAEASDDDDLVPLDGDILDEMIDFDGSDDGTDEETTTWGGISVSGESGNKKRKWIETEKGGKRKKLRSLPTFASYEDYAKMIEDGPEDDI